MYTIRNTFSMDCKKRLLIDKFIIDILAAVNPARGSAYICDIYGFINSYLPIHEFIPDNASNLFNVNDNYILLCKKIHTDLNMLQYDIIKKMRDDFISM